MSEQSPHLARESSTQTPVEKQTLRMDKRSEEVGFDEWLRLLIMATKKEAAP